MTIAISTEREASQKHECKMSGVIDDIAALSSEALSRMMRESRIAIGYQCEDEWIIEQVRHRWRYFVTHCKAAAGSAGRVAHRSRGRR